MKLGKTIMICPRCDFNLNFICHEDMPNGTTLFEYLCEKCLGFLQEFYRYGVLEKSIWGDLFYGRN